MQALYAVLQSIITRIQEVTENASETRPVGVAYRSILSAMRVDDPDQSNQAASTALPNTAPSRLRNRYHVEPPFSGNGPEVRRSGVRTREVISPKSPKTPPHKPTTLHHPVFRGPEAILPPMPIACCLCDSDLDKKFYLECTQCVNFNGDPFAYVS